MRVCCRTGAARDPNRGVGDADQEWKAHSLARMTSVNSAGQMTDSDSALEAMGRSGTLRDRLFGTRTSSTDRTSGSATVRAHAWMCRAARQWVITNRPAFTEDMDAEMTRTTPGYRAVRPGRRAMSLALVLFLTGLALVVSAVGQSAAAAPALAVDRQVVVHQSTPSTGISSPALSTSQPGELI